MHAPQPQHKFTSQCCQMICTNFLSKSLHFGDIMTDKWLHWIFSSHSLWGYQDSCLFQLFCNSHTRLTSRHIILQNHRSQYATYHALVCHISCIRCGQRTTDSKTANSYQWHCSYWLVQLLWFPHLVVARLSAGTTDLWHQPLQFASMQATHRETPALKWIRAVVHWAKINKVLSVIGYLACHGARCGAILQPHRQESQRPVALHCDALV